MNKSFLTLTSQIVAGTTVVERRVLGLLQPRCQVKKYHWSLSFKRRYNIQQSDIDPEQSVNAVVFYVLFSSITFTTVLLCVIVLNVVAPYFYLFIC